MRNHVAGDAENADATKTLGVSPLKRLVNGILTKPDETAVSLRLLFRVEVPEAPRDSFSTLKTSLLAFFSLEKLGRILFLR